MIPVTRVTNVNLPHYQHANYFCVSSEINTEFIAVKLLKECKPLEMSVC